jgi:glycerophosphoryl diester phosphodiesterase
MSNHLLFLIKKRIALLICSLLILCTTGACAAGNLNRTLQNFSDSFTLGQQSSHALYPTLPDCFADPSCTDILIVGHRGTVKFAPENTLAAFELAIELGADVIELDVRNTADGSLVVIHDNTVDRTTDGQGKVSAMTLEEIKALSVRSRYPWVPPQKVLTFREALAFLKGRIPINVDVKTDLLEKIVAEVEDQDMLDQVYMLTKSLDSGYRFRAANPDVKLQARAHSEDEVYRYLAELHPMAIQVDLSFLTPEIVAAINAAAAKVYLDASGSLDAWGRLGYAILDWRGIDVIETDRLLPAVSYARRKRK